MFTSAVSGPGPDLLVGQQAGDGWDGVADVLTATEVSGQGPPGFQVGDTVFDPDAA